MSSTRLPNLLSIFRFRPRQLLVRLVVRCRHLSLQQPPCTPGCKSFSAWSAPPRTPDAHSQTPAHVPSSIGIRFGCAFKYTRRTYSRVAPVVRPLAECLLWFLRLSSESNQASQNQKGWIQVASQGSWISLASRCCESQDHRLDWPVAPRYPSSGTSLSVVVEAVGVISKPQPPVNSRSRSSHFDSIFQSATVGF